MTGTSSYGLQDYIRDLEAIMDRRPSAPVTVREASEITRKLVADKSWLAPEFQEAPEESYARHLLHKDRFNRFVVLSLVWRPGHATPVHDHSCWGVMGIVENALAETNYERLDDGSRPDYAELRESTGTLLNAGSVGYVLPPYQEIHSIGNPTDKESISLHVYGRDLDEVNVYDLTTRKVNPMRIKYYNPDCSGTEFII